MYPLMRGCARAGSDKSRHPNGVAARAGAQNYTDKPRIWGVFFVASNALARWGIFIACILRAHTRMHQALPATLQESEEGTTMATQEKIAAVSELKELFEGSNAVILTEYRGLTVAQLKELRRALGAETEYAVVKNTLAAIAAKEAGIDAFDNQLSGPSAVAFIRGDLIDAAKGLRDFAKANPQLIVKGGYYEGAALTEDDVKRYADLESREVLLSKVAGGAKAAIARIAQVVDALRVKLEEQEGGSPAAEEAAE